MKPISCVIVVDASVAHAAGRSEHPTSRHCRSFLNAIHDNSSCLCAFSPNLNEEWKRHASRLSVTWLTRMYARKRVVTVTDGLNKPLKKALNQCAQRIAGPNQDDLEQKVAAALSKDIHLIDVATSTGKRVASLDDEVRRYLHICADKTAAVKAIVWVNPNTPEESACEWVTLGAPLEPHRTLGHKP